MKGLCAVVGIGTTAVLHSVLIIDLMASAGIDRGVILLILSWLQIWINSFDTWLVLVFMDAKKKKKKKKDKYHMSL